MRRILVERARRKARVRHGGELERIDLEHVTQATTDSDETVLALNEALEKLAREAPQKAEIVKLRYFVGLDYAAIAQALGLSEPNVRRQWAYARSWLYAELKPDGSRGCTMALGAGRGRCEIASPKVILASNLMPT